MTAKINRTRQECLQWIEAVRAADRFVIRSGKNVLQDFSDGRSGQSQIIIFRALINGSVFQKDSHRKGKFFLGFLKQTRRRMVFLNAAEKSGFPLRIMFNHGVSVIPDFCRGNCRKENPVTFVLQNRVEAAQVC